MPRTKGALTKKMTWLVTMHIDGKMVHQAQYPSVRAAATIMDIPYSSMCKIKSGIMDMSTYKYRYAPRIRFDKISASDLTHLKKKMGYKENTKL